MTRLAQYLRWLLLALVVLLVVIIAFACGKKEGNITEKGWEPAYEYWSRQILINYH